MIDLEQMECVDCLVVKLDQELLESRLRCRYLITL